LQNPLDGTTEKLLSIFGGVDEERDDMDNAIHGNSKEKTEFKVSISSSLKEKCKPKQNEKTRNQKCQSKYLSILVLLALLPCFLFPITYFFLMMSENIIG
jgi:hypothetical protein